jgi:chemotaxis receptor (MCP) glutamine deamidase CheD
VQPKPPALQATPRPAPRPATSIVQRRGNLAGVKHGKNITVEEQAIEVPIGGWWYTTEGTPLYTKGVGNCLAIVLNDPESDSGALAHLHDIQAQDFKQEKTTGDKLATYAGTVIGRMLAALGKTTDKLEIMLWKGISFTGKDADIVEAIQKLGWKKVIDLTDRGTSGSDMDKYKLGTGLLYTPKAAKFQFAGSMKFFTFKNPIETDLDSETYRAKAKDVKGMMEMYFAT